MHMLIIKKLNHILSKTDRTLTRAPILYYESLKAQIIILMKLRLFQLIQLQ